MTRGPIEWLANAPVDQLVVTVLLLAGAAGGLIAFLLKWRYDRRQP
jgi:hypothetical protein